MQLYRQPPNFEQLSINDEVIQFNVGKRFFTNPIELLKMTLYSEVFLGGLSVIEEEESLSWSCPFKLMSQTYGPR